MVNDTANVTSEIIICKVAEKQRSTNSSVVAACVYRGLLPGPRGKFGLQLQSDSNFVRPVWLARILGNLKSKLLEEEVSDRVNLGEKGEGKLRSREDGGAAKLMSGFPPMRVGMECQVHFKCTLCALYEPSTTVSDGIVRIEKNPTIIELENRSFDLGSGQDPCWIHVTTVS